MPSPRKGSLAMGIRIGEAISIGDITIRFKEMRGKIQVKVLIEAPLELPITRILDEQTERNTVQRKSR